MDAGQWTGKGGKTHESSQGEQATRQALKLARSEEDNFLSYSLLLSLFAVLGACLICCFVRAKIGDC